VGTFKGIQNLEGRKVGSVNRTTKEVRESFSLLLSNNLEQMNKDLQSLEPFQRIKILLELSKFIIPTLRAVDVKTDNDTPTPIEIFFTTDLEK